MHAEGALPCDEEEKASEQKREEVTSPAQEALSIKEIESQLVDANRILIDINSKIKDVI